MKALITMLLILGWTVSSYAVTATEKIKADNSVEITLTFTQEEMDLFCVDKAIPKEWIRNAVEVNLNHQNSVVADELYKELKFQTPENKSAKIKARKDKRNIKIQKQINEGGEGVIY